MSNRPTRALRQAAPLGSQSACTADLLVGMVASIARCTHQSLPMLECLEMDFGETSKSLSLVRYRKDSLRCESRRTNPVDGEPTRLADDWCWLRLAG